MTYLYPSVFDPTFTFFGYAILVLGGFASYSGVAVGSVVFWALLEGTRLIDTRLSAGQQAALRFIIVGLVSHPAQRAAAAGAPRQSRRDEC